jgi:hypothetical protein
MPPCSRSVCKWFTSTPLKGRHFVHVRAGIATPEKHLQGRVEDGSVLSRRIAYFFILASLAAAVGVGIIALLDGSVPMPRSFARY